MSALFVSRMVFRKLVIFHMAKVMCRRNLSLSLRCGRSRCWGESCPRSNNKKLGEPVNAGCPKGLTVKVKPKGKPIPCQASKEEGVTTRIYGASYEIRRVIVKFYCSKCRDTLLRIRDSLILNENLSINVGLCCICHSEKKTISGPNDTTIETYQPAMPSRAADVVNRMVDIIAYIDQRFDENGQSVRNFITRRTPTVLAGSRLPYLDPIIPFSYDALIAAISRAIDKQAEADGIKVVDTVAATATKKLSYKEVRQECESLWGKLVEKDAENADRILKKVEMIFGHKLKLSEITEDQVDLMDLVNADMREMLAEYK